ncbi:lactoylglutathione lyase [Vibrio nigripulchritudo ATCC 27043]|uniref:Aldoketomutase n=2 Tax=Vibrio nigripulchritudo TaxID=28173 RepID=U4KCF1_9VIBR|nr:MULTISPECIES: glyoxalase superfamily protein [Vibrio]EGU60846.1 lactoylglutathione lyase [Vibrio nigripulchritudo ATCC 27043]KJY74728.1 lactoylglutathione lyase [Vibrio nigripulchritudo]UAB73936.1 VOC family protein [Vibrio sp. SCSIO 43132]CCN72294.1 putative Lactoylglutathione lyase [Vibrio nigripulchritudo SFn118]CCN81284.1 putative Lactoylglutathione lyase [Vibrio nigripulchritudo BLFn1]
MTKAIHSMVRVFDLDKSLEFYDKALGLSVADRYDFDGFSLIYLRNKETAFELELTYNHDQKEPYTHGTGYGHLAVSVDNADESHKMASEAGLEPTPVKEFFHNNERLAKFFFLQDPDGYKIEFIERDGRFE